MILGHRSVLGCVCVFFVCFLLALTVLSEGVKCIHEVMFIQVYLKGFIRVT